MDKDNGIPDELRSMSSTLAVLPRTMPYRVPDGYFAALPDAVLARIADAPDSLSTGHSKHMPFHVPEGYFDTLPTVIATRTQPAGNNPMAVPEGYFDSLPGAILQKAKAADNPIRKTVFFGGAMGRNLRWAAAAILVMGIGIGSYRMYYNTQPLNAEQELAALPASDIHDYINTHIDEFDADMIAGALGPNGIETINTTNIKDEEIQQFLEESGNDTVFN